MKTPSFTTGAASTERPAGFFFHTVLLTFGKFYGTKSLNGSKRSLDSLNLFTRKNGKRPRNKNSLESRKFNLSEKRLT